MTPDAQGRNDPPPVVARRRTLWAALVLLILSLLGLLVWLSWRLETSQVQERLDQDVAAAAANVRAALRRQVQDLHVLGALEAGQTEIWRNNAAQLLLAQRVLLRIEWRDAQFAEVAGADTPMRAPVFDRLGRSNSQTQVALACELAHRVSGPAYAPSYFVPVDIGRGLQVMDLCVPVTASDGLPAYLVGVVSLQDLLAESLAGQMARNQEAFFTEADGTRLAFYGATRRGGNDFRSSHLLDLPGLTLLLRLDGGYTRPSLFSNVLAVVVVALALALGAVVLLLLRDTRRRMQAERGLADALAFRQAMEDSLITGLRARDLEGRTTYVNPAFCRMVGFDREQLLGAPLLPPYWPPEYVAQYLQRQKARLPGYTTPSEGHESVFMRRDGSRCTVLIFEAPLLDATQRHTGWMSAIVDISEQRQAQEQSRASQERLQATARLASVGEMASLLSHELNQPLAAISSYAVGSINLLQGDGSTSNRTLFEEPLRQIAAQAARAGTVIKSVRDFVRRRDSRHVVVAPGELVEAIMPLLNLQARKLGVRIVVRVEAGLPGVACDRAMLEQVLLNLARNALQSMEYASPDQRVMTLSVVCTGSPPLPTQVVFTVTDVGTGISDQVRRKLFTPFFTTKPEGMGLGLSLCRTVVEQHGSELRLEANQPCGTRFWFALAAVSSHSVTPELVASDATGD